MIKQSTNNKPRVKFPYSIQSNSFIQSKGTRAKSDDELEDEFEVKNQLQLYRSTRTIYSDDVYFDEPISDLPKYRNLIHYLHNMNPEDELRIWIDGPGGNLDSTLAIIDAMQNSEGNIQVIVTGNAASAHSLIALSAPNLILGERARFFLHSASYGTGFQKQGEIESFVDYNKTLLRQVMKEAYSGFLSEEELNMLFIGKDYYISGEELTERVKARYDYLSELGAEEVQELQEEDCIAEEVITEVQPPAKPTKKKSIK